jgi:hypothetical protein
MDATYCRHGCCVPCPAQDLVTKLKWSRSSFAYIKLELLIQI